MVRQQVKLAVDNCTGQHIPEEGLFAEPNGICADWLHIRDLPAEAATSGTVSGTTRQDLPGTSLQAAVRPQKRCTPVQREGPTQEIAAEPPLRKHQMSLLARATGTITPHCRQLAQLLLLQ